MEIRNNHNLKVFEKVVIYLTIVEIYSLEVKTKEKVIILVNNNLVALIETH